MENDVVILPESVEAATRRTVTGWVSRNGFFWGEDERMARYDGSTHRKCEKCGQVAPKNYAYCDGCRLKELDERWKALLQKEWDGKTPLAIFDSDTYFFHEEDIECYCEDHECKPEDLRLVFCEPIKPGWIDANDLFADELPGDGSDGVQDEDILAAIDALNKAIEKAAPFSWQPGDVRAMLKPEVAP